MDGRSEGGMSLTNGVSVLFGSTSYTHGPSDVPGLADASLPLVNECFIHERGIPRAMRPGLADTSLPLVNECFIHERVIPRAMCPGLADILRLTHPAS
jgi:hypothetical protein